MTGTRIAAIVRAVLSSPASAETAVDPVLTQWPRQGAVTVFDLEYTAWPGSRARRWSEPWEHREVIQIGAVRLDAGAGFAELESFADLVRPERNPRLSDYITDLTGITDAMIVAEGIAFVEALAHFTDFAQGPIMTFGGDGEVLRENCALAGIDMPLLPWRVVNLGPALCRVLGADYAETTSGDLPSLAGIAPTGRRHDALADARAIAAAMAALRAEAKI